MKVGNVSDKPVEISSYVNRFVGTQIRKFRREQHLTQSELGNLIGGDIALIQSYESGEKRVPASVLPRLADALNKPIGNFFPQKLEHADTSENVNSRDAADNLRQECHDLIDRLTEIEHFQTVLHIVRLLSPNISSQ